MRAALGLIGAFLFLLGAMGCGVLLDLDPPEDAATPGRMDGAVRRDGSGGPCATDLECDDGNPCTEDTCGGEGCRHFEAVCPEIGLECGVYVCVPDEGGCVLGPEPDPTRCDDGVACTDDRCAGASCEHLPDDEACSSTEYCDPGGGCLPLPGCASDVDCPHRTCQQGICEAGRCRYLPSDSPDMDCVPGDACGTAMCVDGSCQTTTRVCGVNSFCDASAGDCACRPGWFDCDRMRSGCECTVSTMDGGVVRSDAGVAPTCFAMTIGLDVDCDGDGVCDCDRSAGYCQGPTCATCLAACMADQVCCPCAPGGCVPSGSVCSCPP